MPMRQRLDLPQDMPVRRYPSSDDNKANTQVVHPTTAVTDTVHRSPFPVKYENEPIACTPNAESIKSEVPVLRLIPRPNSSSKQGKMKLPASIRTQLDSSTDFAAFSAFSTPTKTMIGDRMSLENPSPVPSLLSSPLSMSPHSFLQTPPSFEVERGCKFDQRCDSFSSLQSEQFYFTPLETQDEWIHAVGNVKSDFETIHGDSLDYQIPDLVNPFHHGARHDPTIWETPLHLHFNLPDTDLHTIPRKIPAVVSEVKKLDSLTTDTSSMCGFPPLLNKILEKDYGMDATRQLTTLLSSPKVQVSSNISSGSSNSSSPPLTCPVAPQNLKGDPQRQAKVKTELCVHYLNGSSCPFGDKCNYAHGEEELRYTRLCELQQAGLINDVHKYRSHPCLSWISTGACPFAQRCVNIHDPCVEGSQPSWLPHSEIPGANAETNLHIDMKYHRNMASLHQLNPLVQDTLWKERYEVNLTNTSAGCRNSEWWETYALVCNAGLGNNLPSGGALRNVCMKSPLHAIAVAVKKDPSIPQPKSLSELQRTCIAVLMSYKGQDGNGSIHRSYMYNPRFLVFDKLCMILQTRYFVLVHNSEVETFDNVDILIRSVVREISLEEYNGRRSPWDRRYPFTPKDVFVARELAFGPCGDNTADVSIWFEVPTSEIEACTQQQVKKHKRAKLKLAQQKGNEIDNINSSPRPACSQLHPHKPFYHVQPIMDDDVSYNLILSILHHRVKSLISRSLRGESFSRACRLLGEEESKLQDAYEALKLHCNHWKWGVTSGRVQTTAETLVPPCCVKYKPVTPNAGTSLLWQSFAQNVSTGNHRRECKMAQKNRLGVFGKLGNGASLPNGYRNVPYIVSGKKDIHETRPTDTSAAAWKSMLLDDENHKDWKLIMDQYKANTDSSHTQIVLGDKNLPLTPVVIDKKVMNTKN